MERDKPLINILQPNCSSVGSGAISAASEQHDSCASASSLVDLFFAATGHPVLDVPQSEGAIECASTAPTVGSGALLGFTGAPDEGVINGLDFSHSNAGFEHQNSNHLEYDQIHGYWPPAHPLPLPRWAPEPLIPFRLKNIREYEDLAGKIEMELQNLLEEHNYDTVGNFLELYENFKKSQVRSAIEFFHMYTPRITKEHHTCVGLALELRNRLKKLETSYPNLQKHVSIVSCEEEIGSVDVYTAFRDTFDTMPSTLEKEHCLMCLKFEINDRTGVLLCDPGYHVARVVTVMSDKTYPHTGWFVQSEEKGTRKEYSYSFCTPKGTFVQWDERTTKNGVDDSQYTGIIYVERPYVTAVDVTERRNLIYPFRSLLSRDQKGHLIAGVYFKVKPKINEFTVFYQDMGKQREKLRFSDILRAEVGCWNFILKTCYLMNILFRSMKIF
ncbi:hypothetical protein ABEB36_008806 [Hypothenemus hampei]|uniref:Uncharacterized protein n=1 Tax=Hypothenemus hampei TaxID=57062 RepID=A0ABD1EN84_HYPHA